MATFTPELSPKINKKGESSVRIRVTAQGDTSRIGCGFRIDRNDWNPKKGIVRASHPNHKILNQRISEKLAEVQAKSLTGQGAFAITKQINNESFFKFAYDFIEQFNNSDQFNTFRSYETKLNKIRKFTGTDIKLTDITTEWLRNYETHLKDLGNGEGTRWCDLKTIRAIINGAIREDKLPITANPFLKYKIKTSSGSKARLNESDIEKLRNTTLIGAHAEARDLFLLSFNLRGARISDMLSITGGNISDGRITFSMAKTGREMSIKLTTEAVSIIDRYNKPGKLFSFLKDGDTELKVRIGGATAYINRLLKEVADTCKINKVLTTHVARHTWSQLAKNKGVASAHIQNSLGHSSLRTTEIYLRDLDNNDLDAVNDIVTGKLYN